jgi:hypothetical protein
LNQKEESLLEGIVDRCRLLEQSVEVLLDAVGVLQRLEDRATDSNRLLAKPPARRWVRQKVL